MADQGAFPPLVGRATRGTSQRPHTTGPRSRNGVAFAKHAPSSGCVNPPWGGQRTRMSPEQGGRLGVENHEALRRTLLSESGSPLLGRWRRLRHLLLRHFLPPKSAHPHPPHPPRLLSPAPVARPLRRRCAHSTGSKEAPQHTPLWTGNLSHPRPLPQGRVDMPEPSLGRGSSSAPVP